MRTGSRVAAGLAALLLSACPADGATDGPPVTAEDGVAEVLADKPEVAIPQELPNGLFVEDLVTGEGDVVVEGDTVQVHLVAVAFSTGEQVDSTWELAAPRMVPLVQGGAVEGFLAGVTGMRVGGRRYLVVPPSLGYGDAGAPPKVPPGETLVFVVDVLATERA